MRSWTHLERQRGGFGFLGGPGESQLEIDKRLIGERIARIKEALARVMRTRTLHRNSRRKVPYLTVALVGYTNAGKSSLFNRLTDATVLAQDMLFATLDPTMRALTLPNGQQIILSDTVGFISDLPTHLVAAFRATLEEVTTADIIVHVRDISHDDSEAQADDVSRVLDTLGIHAGTGQDIIEVFNKIDLLTPGARARWIGHAALRQDCVAVSAASGEGIDDLLNLLADRLGHRQICYEISLDPGDGASFAWLHRHGNVVRIHSDENTQAMMIEVRLSAEAVARFEAREIKVKGLGVRSLADAAPVPSPWHGAHTGK